MVQRLKELGGEILCGNEQVDFHVDFNKAGDRAASLRYEIYSPSVNSPEAEHDWFEIPSPVMGPSKA